MATSVVNVGAFLGTAIMQPLVGWVIDHAHAQHAQGAPELGDYQIGLGIMAGFALLGLVATFFVRETYCRYADAK
jgi:polyferredoxin